MDTNTQEPTVSTKELFVRFFSFLRFVYSKWRVWTIALLLGACLALVSDLVVEKELNYKAVILFNLELETAGGGQFGGLAGLGLFNQGTSSGELFTAQNFPLLVKSKKVIEKALMKKVEVNGDSLLMANYIADSSDIAEKEWAGGWFKKPFTLAIDYKFTQKKPDNFTATENLIVNSIYQKLQEATLIGPEGTGSIINLTTLMANEMLAKKWAETLLETTEEFYIEMKTKKTRQMLKVHEARLATIVSQLNNTDSRAAKLATENPYVVMPQAKAQEVKVQRNSAFLTNQYMTQMTTIEGLNRILLEQTPIFTIISDARLPLDPESLSSGLNIKLASLAAFLLAIVMLVLADAYRRLMV